MSSNGLESFIRTNGLDGLQTGVLIELRKESCSYTADNLGFRHQIDEVLVGGTKSKSNTIADTGINQAAINILFRD